MFTYLPILAAILVASPLRKEDVSPHHNRLCRVDSPGDCKNIDQYQGSKGAITLISSFINANSRRSVNRKIEPRYFIERLGVPQEMTNNSNTILMAGCRFNSCSEKAVLLLTKTGSIIGGAVTLTDKFGKDVREVKIISSLKNCNIVRLSIQGWIDNNFSKSHYKPGSCSYLLRTKLGS